MLCFYEQAATFVVSIHKEWKRCKTAAGLINQQKFVNEERCRLTTAVLK